MGQLVLMILRSTDKYEQPWYIRLSVSIALLVYGGRVPENNVTKFWKPLLVDGKAAEISKTKVLQFVSECPIEE